MNQREEQNRVVAVLKKQNATTNRYTRVRKRKILWKACPHKLRVRPNVLNLEGALPQIGAEL